MTGELAQVRIEPTGKVTATMSTHSQGHGTATTMAQIIADRLGVAYEDVTVFEGDSSRGGFSPGAAGSRQGVIAGGAAIMASDLLAAKVKQLAGPSARTPPRETSASKTAWCMSRARRRSRVRCARSPRSPMASPIGCRRL
jgi:carbon-monoxide dehydrogenase large subunit